MRFGIKTLDDACVEGKTVLCRVDINQPVDREKGTLKSINRIEACVPTIRELSDKGARVVLLAHQGSTKITTPPGPTPRSCPGCWTGRSGGSTTCAAPPPGRLS